ncbi:hypothetical protein ACFT9M_11460 [Micromonospora purpureochromogenes]
MLVGRTFSYSDTQRYRPEPPPAGSPAGVRRPGSGVLGGLSTPDR